MPMHNADQPSFRCDQDSFTPDSLADICRETRFVSAQRSERRRFHQLTARRPSPFRSSPSEDWVDFFQKEGSWESNRDHYCQQWQSLKELKHFTLATFENADIYLQPKAYSLEVPFTPALAEISFLVKSLIWYEQHERTLNSLMDQLDEFCYFDILCGDLPQPMPADFSSLMPVLIRAGSRSLLILDYLRQKTLGYLEEYYPFLKNEDRRSLVNTDDYTEQAKLRLQQLFPPTFDLGYLWEFPDHIAEELVIQGTVLVSVTIDPTAWRQEAETFADLRLLPQQHRARHPAGFNSTGPRIK